MYEEKKKTLTMAEEEMEVLFDVECLWHTTQNIRLALPTIVQQLCSILSKENIADCLINEVRIGDKVTLIDKESCRSYRLEMRMNSIYVLGIYEKTISNINTINIIYMPTGQMLQAVSSKVLQVA